MSIAKRVRAYHGNLADDEHHLGVFLLREQRADRKRDLGRRQRRHRHLVEQRLEQVVIGAVDQQNLDVFAAQPTRRGETAETTADDDHALSPSTTDWARCGILGHRRWIIRARLRSGTLRGGFAPATMDL